ncbi:MAG: hypothetical protein DRQ48_05790 [Gammaproteobacteria bacterium]|nr:MAG: hypothetical protein DRQ48_05790 [Gammaproteobacteria bacterium]RLE23291.1 MAG: hypothetical protein DRJ65_12135 [Acidobacteriota bacterium]
MTNAPKIYTPEPESIRLHVISENIEEAMAQHQQLFSESEITSAQDVQDAPGEALDRLALIVNDLSRFQD